MSHQPDLCNAVYPSKSRDPHTRIVHCTLPAGHDGDHEETDTESTWPAAKPDPLADSAEPNAARVLMRIIRSQTGVIVKEHICRRIIDEIVEPARALGIAEGLRQATEGWEREWAVDLGLKGDWPLHPCDNEAHAALVAAARDGRTVVSRLVGPWEPADEPAPVTHALGCMCGTNDAGQRFNDPICRRTP